MHRLVCSATYRKGLYTRPPRFSHVSASPISLYPNTVVRAGGGRFVRIRDHRQHFPGRQLSVPADGHRQQCLGRQPWRRVEPRPSNLPSPHLDEQQPGAPDEVELEHDRPAGAPAALVASIAYVGARGLHNWDVFDINQPRPVLSPNPGLTLAISGPIKVSTQFSKRKAG